MRIRLSVWTLLLSTTLASVGCHFTGGHNLPPAQRLAEPGPGVGGPGPGVLTPPMPPIAQVSATEGVPGCAPGGATYGVAPAGQPVQVIFNRPESMQVFWDVSGSGTYDSMGLITPGRQSFQQGGIFRLKLTNIENREGVELYPTLEVGPPTHRSAAYLAHSAIPIQFTEEDFNQALSGNFVTKVIYLPDPEFQALAVADVQTLVSTRLDPGQDPITEAENRGAILAVVRLGNKDMETPGMSGGSGTVMPASFNMSMGGTPGCNYGCPPTDNPTAGTMMMPSGPPPFVAGVNAPQYGMTMSGTPIGLPGPPHIPLGVPAGLQKHVVKNWTRHHIPAPTSKVQLNVKQNPGISYPQPANRAWITEDTIHPSVRFSNQHFGPAPTGQIHYNCGPNGCN